jgi:ribosomal protein L37AE/L43A
MAYLKSPPAPESRTHAKYISPFVEPEVLRCPECRSEDVDPNYVGAYLKCRKCGYVDFNIGRWLKKKDEILTKEE